MPELAFLNGEILPIENAMVPIEDRGYQFGDAVYEYIATYDGRLFCEKAHLERLERSLTELSFPAVNISGIRDAVHRLLNKSGIARAGIYIQISRGAAPRKHEYPDNLDIQVVMTVRRLKDINPEIIHDGVDAVTVEDIRWGRCDIKTVQLLPNVMAKQQALDAGAYDAVFISADDQVREGTISNVFIVNCGVVITHPLTQNILSGITRMVILDICREAGIPFEERFYGRDTLFSADEAFYSGTTIEVLPIVKIDGKKIGNGKPGPVTQRLFKLFREKASG